MRRLLFLMSVLVYAFNMQAQDVQRDEDSQIEFTRGRIGIDYSMPDFSTKRIDGSIIGDHLADMLNYLESNYSRGACNGKLMSIVRDQEEFIFPPKIKSIKVRRIVKDGDVITVNTRITLSKNHEGIGNLDIPFVFEKGVSRNRLVNNLFFCLSRGSQELQ